MWCYQGLLNQSWGVPPGWGLRRADLTSGGGVRLNVGMPISHEELKQHIHQSGFNAEERLRTQALDIIWNGLQLFRANKKRKYMSHTGKLVNKPSPTHAAPQGRHDQTEIRTVLISAICRAWIIGTDIQLTLNHKKDYDSDFMSFASYIMSKEGIGRVHDKLEKYWSRRKADWIKNTNDEEKWRLSGGSETSP